MFLGAIEQFFPLILASFPGMQCLAEEGQC